MTHAEKLEFYTAEKNAQNKLDKWYMERGHTVDRSGACKLFDCVIDGRFKVEEKIRDGKRTDILVEIIQDLKTNSNGWVYETGCDYLHYIFTENGELSAMLRFCWKDFLSWYFDTYLVEKKTGRHIISSRGWGLTLNLIVPICDIPKNILWTHRFEKVLPVAE